MVIPFLANRRSMSPTEMFGGGSNESASVLLGALKESLLPKGTLMYGPPDKATASRAANMITSLHETFPGHSDSNIDFA